MLGTKRVDALGRKGGRAIMAGIGKKVEEEAKKAAKDKVSGGKEGKSPGGGSEKSGVDKAKKVGKDLLK